jgi:hypothetical protein
MQLNTITVTKSGHVTHYLSMAHGEKDLCYGSNHFYQFPKKLEAEY